MAGACWWWVRLLNWDVTLTRDKEALSMAVAMRESVVVMTLTTMTRMAMTTMACWDTKTHAIRIHFGGISSPAHVYFLFHYGCWYLSYGIYSCQIYCCLPWSHHLPQLLAAGRAVVHPDRREATRTTPALAVPAGSSCWRRMMMQ